MDHCQQEGTIKEIKDNISVLVEELRGIMKEMRGAFADDREFRVRLDHVERDTDLLFKRVRKMEDDVVPSILKTIDKKYTELSQKSSTTTRDLHDKIEREIKAVSDNVQPLIDWKNKWSGAIAVLLIGSPVISAIAAVIAVLISMEKGATP